MELDDALRSFAGHRRVLIASDFDGTLSEIVPIPGDARPVPGAVEVLTELADLPNVHLMLVSGRSLDDLIARFEGRLPESIMTIGEHGAARHDRQIEHPEGMDRLVEGFRALASTADGAEVEVKQSAVSFHFRNVDPLSAERLVEEVMLFAREVVDQLPDEPRIEKGRGVVEVAFDAAHKGDAVVEMKERLGAGAVLYFGDDVSDEAVFESIGRDDVGVKVGDGETVAPYRVAGPAQVVEALELVASLRS